VSQNRGTSFWQKSKSRSLYVQTDGKLMVDKARAKRTKGIQSVGTAERQNNSMGWGA